MDALQRARAAFERRAWIDACAAFGEADRDALLEVGDLEHFAASAHILGHREETIDAFTRVYRARVGAGEIGEAVRCAFWLREVLAIQGEFAHAAGWLARAARLAEQRPDCPERAYLLLAEAEEQAGEQAFATAGEAVELGNRCGDRDVVVIGVHIQGRTRLAEGRIPEGLALLDEAMLGIAAGETSTQVTGWMYCSMIGACHDVHELRRAREWTAALNAWCDALPQFTGAYSGICRVHRAELLRLGGAWPDAVREARSACERFGEGYGQVVAGMAFYQLGEIHRLRGELAHAQEAYRRASEHGWDTQPGLALLRLAQGKAGPAAAALRRALGESPDAMTRSRLLPAQVEIALAVSDAGAARSAAEELSGIADSFGTSALRALSLCATGAVDLADGDAGSALPLLRRAWRLWSDLDAPYEVARTRVLLGTACRALGDEDGATMELAAAAKTFAQLGAATDLAKLDGGGSVLSPREIEVLRLLAGGLTNRGIANRLVLSDKTVARHVSNIFTKLGVGSRTAAAAYAFEHGIG